MIKAVLFDFDGVLTLDETGTQTICNYIAGKCSINQDELLTEYSKFNEDLLLGKRSHEDIWTDLLSALNETFDIQVLYDSFISTALNTKMLTLVESLKKNSYKTAVITNNKSDRIKMIWQFNKLDRYFDTVKVSADIGSGKDEAVIFKKTLSDLNMHGADCVFIDNTKNNLIIPKKMGMKTIFYDYSKKDFKGMLNQLKDLGIKYN